MPGKQRTGDRSVRGRRVRSEPIVLRQVLTPTDAQYRALVENTSDLILSLARDGTIRYASPSFERVLGYGCERPVGRNAADFVHPDDAAALKSAIEGVAGTGEPSSPVAHRWRHADGSERMLEFVGAGRLPARGTRVRLVQFRDVIRDREREVGECKPAEPRLRATDERLAESALRASEERNRLALQAARMGTWDVDPLQDVVTWSAETEALHGLAPGTFGRTRTALRGTVDPRDWAAFELEMRAADTEHRETLATYRTIWPNGTVRWIESKGRTQRAADGTRQRITGTSMDITQRKLAEEALQASEERFRRQYKGMPVPTYSWLQVGDDFELQDYNDAAEAYSGANIKDRLGQRASERHTQHPLMLANLRTCVAEQRTIRRETRYRYPDTGQDRVMALSFVFVPPRTVMVHTEDVTEIRQAEQQREAMAQSEKLRALGQMATGIAHDINQSLMLVASYSDLARAALVQHPPDLAEVEDLLTTTTQAALDGGETVNRLLLFTRAAPEHESRAVDLADLVRDAARLTAPRWRDASQAEGRPISLHVEAEGHPTVQGSPSRLRELMTNLIFNAVDALPGGGTIRLRAAVKDDLAILEVSDSGVGMTTEVQQRVFEPFFTTKGESGTGLGLAMVFGIVKQHRGRIDLQSATGSGATFRITFPQLATPGVGNSLPGLIVRTARPGPLRVLAVDDEPMITRAIVRMLRPSGHVVTVAGSGEEAVARLQGQTFDVVVSDMGMGAGMNGWELADVVRRRWPRVRFVLATGWGAAIDPGQAQTRGVEAVLAKPYQLVDLLRALAGGDPMARVA